MAYWKITIFHRRCIFKNGDFPLSCCFSGGVDGFEGIMSVSWIYPPVSNRFSTQDSRSSKNVLSSWWRRLHPRWGMNLKCNSIGPQTFNVDSPESLLTKMGITLTLETCL